MKKFINKAKVYILTNPAMPGLVRIEKTKSGSINDRLDELNSTGVPVPYECAFFARVADGAKVESAFHRIFGPYRLNSKRDFFRIKPEQAIASLELITDAGAQRHVLHRRGLGRRRCNCPQGAR